MISRSDLFTPLVVNACGYSRYASFLVGFLSMLYSAPLASQSNQQRPQLKATTADTATPPYDLISTDLTMSRRKAPPLNHNPWRTTKVRLRPHNCQPLPLHPRRRHQDAHRTANHSLESRLEPPSHHANGLLHLNTLPPRTRRLHEQRVVGHPT